MKPSEFNALVVALLLEITGAFLLGTLILSFFPQLRENQSFLWSFSILLLAYVMLTLPALQRTIESFLGR
jgi:hypothetical protein